MSDQSELPGHWELTPIAEFAELISGQHILSDDYHQNPGDGGTPYLTGPADFGAHYPEVSKWTEKPKAMARDGDVLLTVKGANVGKTNVLNIEEAAISRQLMAIRPQAVLSEYVYYYFRNNFSEFQRLGAGSTVPGIDQESVLGFEVPLPPLPEQRRIVAKIEELFSNLDAGMDDLQAAGQQLERYRLSVLQAAVEGRLTADWRRTHDPEPADQLLERILEEHKKSWEDNYRAKYAEKERDLPNRWKSRYSPPEVGDMSDQPELPEGWTWVRFDCLLSQKLRNGKSAKTAKDGNGVRVLTLSAVTDGEFTLDNTKIGDFKPEKVEDLWLEPGDLLIERSNTAELVGTTRLYRGERDFAIFPDLVIRARVTDVMLDEYAELALQSHRVHSFFREEARGTSGSMQKINQSIVGNAPIPVPPLKEQKQIVDEVERLLSVADDTAATAERERTRAERLRQSVLKQAFSGRLVPHDEDATSPAIEASSSNRKGQDASGDTDASASEDSSDRDDVMAEELYNSGDPGKQIEMDL